MVECGFGSLHFTNPVAIKSFDGQLDNLVKKYQVNGFKFHAGDAHFYSGNIHHQNKITSNEHRKAYAQLG